MATNEVKIPIPARLYNASEGGHVAGADQIIDDETGLTLDKVTGGALEEKEYTSGSDNGMGRVVLRKNLVNGVNTLVQTMINNSNTIYVIQYDFVLGGDITIPANCVLEFDGGSISASGSNDTITGNNTGICAALIKIFYTNITLTGSFKVDYIRPEWFGAKGDYNVSTKIGTDDSIAITKAIRVAELLNVGKVKFASSNYFVSTGIHITRGNILLDGVRALLREDQWENSTAEPISTQCSALYCHKGTTILTCDEGATDPIRITNLQFICDEVDYSEETIAIKVTNTDINPIWPFIVEYCYLHAFSKAIDFDSTNHYLVYGLYVNHNAFSRNLWCVYFEEQSIISDTGVHSNLTWSFDFKNNKAHHNIHIIKACSIYGRCEISGNNMEGDYSYDDGINYINIITTGQGCNFIFNDNHFELINKIPLMIEAGVGEADICIKGNNLIGVSNASCKKIHITKANRGSALLNVSETNIPLLVKDVSVGLGLGFENPIPFEIQNCNIVTVITSKPYISADINTADSYFINGIPSSSDIVFAGKEVYSKALTTRQVAGVTLVNSGEQRSLIVMFCKIIKSVWPGLLLAWTNNTTQESIFMDINATWYSRIKDKYIYSIVMQNYAGGSYEFYTTGDIQAHIKNYGYAMKTVNKSDVISSNVLSNLTDDTNVVYDLPNLTINNLRIGLKVFDKNSNKEYIYNGTSWVDAAGTPV